MEGGLNRSRQLKRILLAGWMRGTWALVLAATLVAAPALGQKRKQTRPKSAPAKPADQLSKTKSDVVNATLDLKAKVETLIGLYSADLKDAQETFKKRQELLAQGLISKRELDESERKVAEIQSKIEGAKRDIKEADELVAEVTAGEQLARVPSGATIVTGAFTRFAGWAKWSITDASKVQNFFSTRFGHALPVSAYGQSAFHERVGLDHHNAMDVAVHPDSAEGQALMGFLRSAGIPFIAFRQAVAGSATGAHIHVGLPSHRIARSSAAP